jgi:predicted GIY-YIG superfamily endonuclease
MVHWVYVLECEDDYVYIGETTRLFRRFTEHITGRGGANTHKNRPNKLIGLYKVCDNYSFIKYRNSIKSGQYNKFIIDDWENDGDNLLIENHITERFFYERRDNDYYGGGLEWYKVRGGKYTKENLDTIVASYKWASEKEGRMCKAGNPINNIPVDDIVDRPLCNCGNPSEVKLSKDRSKIYFICSLKNVWDEFYSYLEIDEACDFWQLYTEDAILKVEYEISKKRSYESWVKNIPITKSKVFPDSCISCNTLEYVPIFNSGPRRLCQSCIVKKYTELKEKYNNTPCLIED